MKQCVSILVLIATHAFSAQPADPVQVGSRILDRGPHHTSWETTWETQDPTASPELTTHHFVQLTTGLNRIDPATGDWIPAVAVWETTAEGCIVARHAIGFDVSRRLRAGQRRARHR